MLSLNCNPFPLLYTERLILREITTLDAPAILNLRSNAKVMKYIDRPMAETLEDAIELISKIEESIKLDDGITWGICLKEKNELIGTIGFWRFDKPNYRAEIGYMIIPEWQGKGLMREAMTTIIKFGFENLNIHSIEANVNPENQVSKKMLEKNGFVQEAYFKENYFYNGTFLDSMIYSLISPVGRKDGK